MFRKKEWIAMLLAGGQGSRLYALTKMLAKPAVPYGGKYRIIDFPLSNCINSGIDTVGVLTQYQPLVLNEYLGNGEPWDLDRSTGGLFILPPYQTCSGSDWYTGTTNAIYQNMPFIERYDPDYVLVISGDHIYKMNYELMLRQHKATGADCTIAVLQVPLEEASRFGIMNCDGTGRILEFEEKPKQPKSNLASMGIYIFTWEKLREYLVEDEENSASDHDFGKNVIPAMLAAGEKMYAYAFSGYWKDVGTIDSLWEANMDLLHPDVPTQIYDPQWKIYARNAVMPPHYVAPEGRVENSIVTEGAEVYGSVSDSVVFSGVVIEEGARVRDSILMPGARVKKGAAVEYAILAEDAVAEEETVIGAPRESWPHPTGGIAVVGAGVTVGRGSRVSPGQMVEMDIPAGRRIADD